MNHDELRQQRHAVVDYLRHVAGHLWESSSFTAMMLNVCATQIELDAHREPCLHADCRGKS